MSRSPGIYPTLSEHEYHADIDWLSSTGVRELIKPGGPARFQYARLHGSKNTAHYDEGHAAHADVLGTGLDVVEIHAKDYNTKKAQAERDQAHADGKVPLLSAKVAMVRAMGNAVREHAEASALLTGGLPEVSAYTVDDASWIRLRSRTDYLIYRTPDLVTVVDYKTTTDASPRAFAASAAKYGYWIQDAFYRRVLAGRGLEVERFVFIAQEKTPPYLLSLHESDPEDLELADRLIELGIEIFSDCTAAGVWPGYGDHIHRMRLSSRARYLAEELLAA